MSPTSESVTYRTPSWSHDDGVRAAGHEEAVDSTVAAKLRRVQSVLVQPSPSPAAPSTVSLQDAARHLLHAQGLDMPDEVRQILQGFASVTEPVTDDPDEKAPAKKTARKSSSTKPPAD